MSPFYNEQVLTVARNDNSVNIMVRWGAPTCDIICVLAQEKATLLKRIAELEMLVPKKIKVGDKMLVWHCPDQLIPLSQEIP